METVYTPPNILRLTGITLKDYVPVEDVADTRLLDPSTEGPGADPDAPAPEAIHPPDKIPRVFTGLEDWPHHTNLKCWECGFTFDDRPKFTSPYVREAENGGIELGVQGNFCTFNHAELWIETHLGGRASNEERWHVQDNLCLVYFLFTGRRTSRIKPGPPKTELRQYGGDLDEDTYWKKLRELDPIAGLRDHTLGSIVPERERIKTVLAGLRARDSAVPIPRSLARESSIARKPAPGEPLPVSANSVWGVCGLPAADLPAAAPERESDSIAVECPRPGHSTTRDDNIPVREDDDLETMLAARDTAAPDLEALLTEAAEEAAAAATATPPMVGKKAPVAPPTAALPAPAAVTDTDLDVMLADLGVL